ncbi:MAG: hypothetical protein IJN59_06590 [Oscillospiraceae bacterium]|nr:hypothetical protein [Oscillospiraceae bacterium]MBR2503327.1 hypothetical protein [Oscillospiraceae bacterium]
MKLKVLKEFFDRKEDKYVYPSKTPTIDREEKRAAELIAAGVAEEYVEGTAPETVPAAPETAPAAPETAPAEPEQAEAPAEEKPAKKGGKK